MANKKETFEEFKAAQAARFSPMTIKNRGFKKRMKKAWEKGEDSKTFIRKYLEHQMNSISKNSNF